MLGLIKLILENKFNSITNLTFLLNSVSNNEHLINNPDIHTRNLSSIKNKISNPVTGFIAQAEIDSIDSPCTRVFICRLL